MNAQLRGHFRGRFAAVEPQLNRLRLKALSNFFRVCLDWITGLLIRVYCSLSFLPVSAKSAQPQSANLLRRIPNSQARSVERPAKLWLARRAAKKVSWTISLCHSRIAHPNHRETEEHIPVGFQPPVRVPAPARCQNLGDEASPPIWAESGFVLMPSPYRLWSLPPSTRITQESSNYDRPSQGRQRQTGSGGRRSADLRLRVNPATEGLRPPDLVEVD